MIHKEDIFDTFEEDTEKIEHITMLLAKDRILGETVSFTFKFLPFYDYCNMMYFLDLKNA